jgi:hypothetical protein
MGALHVLHAAYATFLFDAAALAYLHHLPGACCVGGGHSLRSFSQLHGINGFVFLLIAWGVLMAGVLIRGRITSTAAYT